MAERSTASMSIGTKALIGLALGLAAGSAVTASGRASLVEAGAAVEVIGSLWINAILATILPLVVSKLVVSIAGETDAAVLGRTGWRTAGLFLFLLVAAATLSALVMPGVFGWLPMDPGASAALRASVQAPATPPAPPRAVQVVLGFVPANVVRAAADGAIVPLIVFFAAFGFALRRIPAALGQSLLAFFRAIDAATTVLLHWIVALSPYAVAALGFGLVLHVGAGLVTALAYYVVVSSVVLVLFTAALYVVVLVGAGIPPARFARAAGPAQVVAFGTHSSMASLPAMLEGAESRLGLSPAATGFVLPLSLAVFKYSGPVWFVTVAYFVGRLYGVVIDPSRALAIVVASVVTSLAVGGVPSGAAVVVAPVLSAAGLPVEAMALLLAVDPIPNAFRTVANVTGMLAVTALADPGTSVPAAAVTGGAMPEPAPPAPLGGVEIQR